MHSASKRRLIDTDTYRLRTLINYIVSPLEFAPDNAKVIASIVKKLFGIDINTFNVKTQSYQEWVRSLNLNKLNNTDYIVSTKDNLVMWNDCWYVHIIQIINGELEFILRNKNHDYSRVSKRKVGAKQYWD